MNLSAADLLTLAQNAGFSGPDLATAVAVALAESEGGNPQAYNPEAAWFDRHPQIARQGQGSYGLWQIFLHEHPEFVGVNLFDPQTNANAAFSVYSAAGNSFRPWSTFLSGAYLGPLAEVNQVLATAVPPTPMPADTTTPVDTTAPADSGFTPNGGDLLSMVAVGALVLWASWRLMG